MSKEPLTMTIAVLRFACASCKDGVPCEHGCVESCTCSMPCPECASRVFFSGNLGDAPRTYICPYCGEEVKNPWGRDFSKAVSSK